MKMNPANPKASIQEPGTSSRSFDATPLGLSCFVRTICCQPRCPEGELPAKHLGLAITRLCFRFPHQASNSRVNSSAAPPRRTFITSSEIHPAKIQKVLYRAPSSLGRLLGRLF